MSTDATKAQDPSFEIQSALREQGIQERRREVHAALPELASMIRSAGASRVFVFGSVAEGTEHERSDLDLACWDLPADRYFDLLAELILRAPVPVDLVRLESAPPSLVAKVQQDGRELLDEAPS